MIERDRMVFAIIRVRCRANRNFDGLAGTHAADFYHASIRAVAIVGHRDGAGIAGFVL